MTLSANGSTFKVMHSFPDHLLLAEPATLEPGQAKLTISIDGEETEIPFEIRTAVSGQRIEADLASETAQVV